MSLQNSSFFLKELILRLAGENQQDLCLIKLEWKNTVGSAFAAKAKPVRFDNGILKVAVENNIWLQELILYKHKFRAVYLKKHKLDIKDIIFFVKTG